MFEAVKIRKAGFPFRLTHTDFMERYGCITGKENATGGSKSDCQKLVDETKINKANVCSVCHTARESGGGWKRRCGGVEGFLPMLG